MKHTLEIRAPFFDTKIIQYALKIDPTLKIKTVDHKVITKYILRRVAEQFLPKSIAYRYKVPFSNGAGMNV
jgi:asparagine synthase (glutamine-hydrolysing)